MFVCLCVMRYTPLSCASSLDSIRSQVEKSLDAFIRDRKKLQEILVRDIKPLRIFSLNDIVLDLFIFKAVSVCVSQCVATFTT